jgi:hypothetical protein
MSLLIKGNLMMLGGGLIWLQIEDKPTKPKIKCERDAKTFNPHFSTRVE